MPPGLLASRSSRCVACLVMAVGAALGPPAWAHGEGRAPTTSDQADPARAPAAAMTSARFTGPPELTAYAPPAAIAGSAAGAVPPALSAAGDVSAASVVFSFSRPSTSPDGSPSAEESPLAGRQAGEGRARPGRSLSPDEIADSEAADDEMPPDSDPAVVPEFTPPPDAFPEPGETARQRQALDEPTVRQVRDVSLGSGIALVGMGLAFLALRMRRTS